MSGKVNEIERFCLPDGSVVRVGVSETEKAYARVYICMHTWDEWNLKASVLKVVRLNIAGLIPKKGRH